MILEWAHPDQKEEVKHYINQVSHKSELDRQEKIKAQKTGVFLGRYALNPINQKKKIPIWFLIMF